MESPALHLKQVTKIFTDVPGERLTVLKDINLEIKMGEIFVIVGPSGSGKSTLLRIMSGLDKSFKGEMQLGEGIKSNDLSFVFQQFALLPWLTVAENVELGLIGRNVPKHERKGIVSKELAQLHLHEFARSHPRELSGGMRQRVGLARALAVNPKIIFMDEPFSELDSFTVLGLHKELLSVWEQRKPTIVMVTHLIEEALELADRIAVLEPSTGQIEKIITNHLPRPRDKRSEEFFRLEDEIYRLIKS